MTSFPQRAWKALAAATDLASAIMIQLLERPVAWNPDRVRKSPLFSYGGLGDVIFLLPAAEALRARFPSARIEAVTGTYSSGRELLLLKGLFDRVRVVDWTGMGRSERRAVCAEIGRENFDAALVPYTSATRFFMPALRRIPLRVGEVRVIPKSGLSTLRTKFDFYIWQEELFRRAVFNRPVRIDVDGNEEHDVYKHLRMAHALHAPELSDIGPRIETAETGEAFAAEFLKRENPRNERLLGVSLGVSRGMEWKIWNVARMAAACRALRDRRGLLPLVVGAAADGPLAAEFRKAYGGPVIDAVGRTGVMEMAALIRRCALFLSNDSGPSKLAMALRVPTAIIWGASDRHGAGPWSPGPFATIHHDPACAPAYAVGLHRRTIDHDCLDAVSVDAVVKAAEELIEN